MSKYALAYTFWISLALAGPALADDWTGQTPPPGVVGPFGTAQVPGKPMTSEDAILVCLPGGTPLPCGPGTHVSYDFTGNGTVIPSLPAGAGAANSNVGVVFSGYYANPASPTGISLVGGTLPLSAFARSATVDALNSTVGTLTTSLAALNTSFNTLNGTVGGLQTTVGALNSTVGSLGTSFNALSATVGTLGTSVSALSASVSTASTQLQSLSIQFNQLQQQTQIEDRTLRQGVAMSLAMDGVGDLGADEHFAISMNFGTFGGQNGMAAGFAFRAAEHLTFNGGIGAGVNGGLVGGRVGARLAW